MIGAFEDEYKIQFSRPVPGMKIEILNWTVRAATTPQPLPSQIDAPNPRTLTAKETRDIICDLDGTPISAGLFARDDLAEGDTIKGPALIYEAQTTTLVSVDFTAHVDGYKNLILTQISRGDRT